MSTPRYSVKLESKVLTRARKILGLLLLLSAVLIIAGIHQGIVSKDFDKVFIQPFRQFAADLDKATQPIPTLAPLPTLSPTPASLPAKQTVPAQKPAVKQTQPVVSSCIRKNIREGEFASNKCYSQQDYEDLEYYLSRFSSAVFSKDSAESSMRITCNCRVQQECDFFKDSCERDKQKKSQAESDINKYRGIIQGIIAKGQ